MSLTSPTNTSNPEKSPSQPPGPSYQTTLLYNSLIATLIIAMAVTLLTGNIFKHDLEQYSSISLTPNKYSSIITADEIYLDYQVYSTHKKKTSFILTYYLNNQRVDQETFSLNFRQTHQKNLTLKIPPNIQFPINVSLFLREEERWDVREIHFWVYKTPPPIYIDPGINGTQTNNDSITITGRCQRTANLWIGKQSVDMEGNEFKAKIPLEYGLNEIRIKANDFWKESTEVLLYVLRIDKARLTMFQPENDSLVGNPTQIYAGIMDNDSKLYINGRYINASGPRFEGEITLKEGVNHINFTAQDTFGNTNSKIITLTLETRYDLAITDPQPDTTTNTETIIVQGQGKNDSYITVNGKEAFIDETGMFKAPVQLNEGKNEILIQAVDKIGNSYNKTIAITLDTTPPDILSRGPATAQVATDVVLTVFTDEKAECRWDTQEKEFEAMTNTFLHDPMGLQHFANYKAQTGGNEVFFVCKDTIGNPTLIESISFPVGSPQPVVTSKSPRGTINDESVRMEIETDENAICRYDLTDKGYSELENEFDDTGGEEHSTHLKNLDEGKHTYYIRCKNENGLVMTSSSTVSFTVDTKPPKITRVHPSNSVSDPKQELSVIVDEKATCRFDTQDAIYDNLQNIMQKEGSFQHVADITLQTGENKYYVRCEDENGNAMTSSQEVVINLDYDAPVITSVFPQGNLSNANVVLSVETDEWARCRFDLADKEYEQMTKTFSSTDGIFHISPYSAQSGLNVIYVRCEDENFNKMSASSIISFWVQQ